MKNRIDTIIDTIIFQDKRQPLRKSPCVGCAIIFKEGDLSDLEGLCPSCYVDYCQDMAEQARSDSENYRLAH